MSKPLASKSNTTGAFRWRFISLGLRFFLLVLTSLMVAGWITNHFAPTGQTVWWLLVSYAISCCFLGWLVLHNLIWRVSAVLFYPLYLFGLQSPWMGGVALLMLVLLVLLMGQSWRGRVPLFLSSRRLLLQLDLLLPVRAGLRMAEMGAGNGRVLAVMAGLRPAAHIDGYEVARLPYWFAKWRFRRQPLITLKCQDFMLTDWSCYDVVYVFLSPLVMEEVWQKALAEMKNDAILISNSFAVPGVPVDEEVVLPSGQQSRLMAWRVGNHKGVPHGS